MMWTSIRRLFGCDTVADTSAHEDNQSDIPADDSEARVLALAPRLVRTAYAIGMLHARWRNAYRQRSRRRSVLIAVAGVLSAIVGERLGIPRDLLGD